MLQNVVLFLPILASAICIPFLFWRAGHQAKIVWLSGLPIIVTVSSLLAVVVEGRPPLDGPIGAWAVAATLIALAVLPRPQTSGANEPRD